MNTRKTIFNTVIAEDYCVGCGVCALVSKSISIDWSVEEGRFFPKKLIDTFNQAENEKFGRICPFSEDADNEDVLAKELFPANSKHHSCSGYYLQAYAGYVSEGDFREKGSSGGMGSWLVAELFRRGLVDGVIHVQACPNEAPLFRYHISRSIGEMRRGAKSRYYPIELSQVLKQVREIPGRYVLVGVPCFIKAVRLLAREDLLFKERICYTIGLVCGHLKTAHFAEMLGWQAGIEPAELGQIDFRHKLEVGSAGRYAYRAVSKGGYESIKAMATVIGGDWGMGFFKFKSCDYCDDVLAETADIVIGDAWLREYSEDPKGTNIVVVRTKIFADIIRAGIVERRLRLNEVPIETAIRSQDAGIRHRREGLAYRLALARQREAWVPDKRFTSNEGSVSLARSKIYKIREDLRDESQRAFKEAKVQRNWGLFIARIKKPTACYRTAYAPLWRRLLARINWALRLFLK